MFNPTMAITDESAIDLLIADLRSAAEQEAHESAAGRMGRAADALAEVAALAASQAEQIAGMAKALEPFSKKFSSHKNCRYGPSGGPHEDHDEIPVHFGDLRAAKAAYDATQRKPTDG